MKTVKDVEDILVTLHNFNIEPMILESTRQSQTPKQIRREIDKTKKTLSKPLLELWKKLQKLCITSGKAVKKKGMIDFPNLDMPLSNKEEIILNKLLERIEDTPYSIVI